MLFWRYDDDYDYDDDDDDNDDDNHTRYADCLVGSINDNVDVVVTIRLLSSDLLLAIL